MNLRRSLARTIAPLGLTLLLLLPTVHAEIFYPWKDTYIGALEGAAWPGLVIALNKEAAFAFVLRVEKDGMVAEAGDFFYLASQVGPLSPDGQYARMKFDLSLPFKTAAETPILIKPAPRKQTLTVEWSRRDGKTVIGRVLCPADIKVDIVHYFPWDFKGEYALLSDGQVQGTAGTARKQHYLLWVNRPGEPASASQDQMALSFSTGDDRSLYFVAGADEDVHHIARPLRPHDHASSPGPSVTLAGRVWRPGRPRKSWKPFFSSHLR